MKGEGSGTNPKSTQAGLCAVAGTVTQPMRTVLTLPTRDPSFNPFISKPGNKSLGLNNNKKRWIVVCGRILKRSGHRNALYHKLGLHLKFYSFSKN